MIEYTERTGQIIFGNRSGLGIEDRILSMLNAQPMTTTEMYKHFANNEKLMLAEHLARMEAMGRVEKRKEKKRAIGRPAMAWSVRR